MQESKYQQLKQEAKKLLHRGCYRTAVTRYSQLLAMPESAKERHILHTNRGVALHGLERVEEASESYCLALQADPSYIKARFRLLQAKCDLKLWVDFMQQLNQFQKATKSARYQEVDALLQIALQEIQSIPKFQNIGPRLFTKIVKSLSATDRGVNLLQTALTREDKEPARLEIVRGLVAAKKQLQQTSLFSVADQFSNVAGVSLFFQLLPYGQSKQAASFLKKVGARVQQLVKSEQGTRNLLAIPRGLRARGAAISVASGFYQSLMLKAQSLYRVRQFQILVSQLIRLINSIDTKYFSQQQLQRFNIQGLLVARALGLKVSQDFKRKGLQCFGCYSLLLSVLPPFSGPLPLGPPSNFSDRVNYYNVYIACQNEWTEALSIFTNQLLGVLDTGNRSASSPDIALYHSLTLLCSKKECLKMVQNAIQRNKFPDFLRSNCELAQHLADILLNPIKKPEQQIPKQLADLINKNQPQRPEPLSEQGKRNLARYLPSLQVNPRSRRIVRALTEGRPQLCRLYTGFIVSDQQQAYPQFCRWAKDNQIQWKYSQAAARSIMGMLPKLSHEFDIFAGLLAILKIKNCHEACFQKLQVLKNLIFQQNLYIVHAALQVFNNVLAFRQELLSQNAVLDICVAYYKTLDLKDKTKKITDFSCSRKMYPTICGLLMQFSSKEEKWVADKLPTNAKQGS